MAVDRDPSIMIICLSVGFLVIIVLVAASCVVLKKKSRGPLPFCFVNPVWSSDKEGGDTDVEDGDTDVENNEVWLD